MEDLDLGATIRGFVTGQKVFGRYTLKKQLGRGGMGVVWRARDESLEQDVAIKMLPEIVANDPASVRELKRETSRNQQLSHPHILRVFDFVESGALCGITMEVAEGGTLTQRRLDQPQEHFEVEDLREWVRQLCEALDHAHRRAKVVHRDLKPANLMLTAGGELKVTDFGIAASLSESMTRVSKQGSSSGTPLYMSPQQMMGEKPAVTDDLYALGATLYELLTGKPPFFSGNVILQVQNKAAPSLADRRRDLEVTGAPIPPEWEETIAACLAKDPKDRPQSAREVAERLGLVEGSAASSPARKGTTEKPVAAAAPVPAATAPDSSARPVAARSGRTKALVGLAAALVLTAGAVWWFGVTAPELERQKAAAAQARAVEAQQAQAAEAEYTHMKALVARLSPDLPEAEMEKLNDEVAGYFNHGGGTTPRHLEIRDELARRFEAWQAADKRRKEDAAAAEQKRLAQEKSDREAAEQAAAREKAETERVAREKAETERVARENAAREEAARRAREGERDGRALALARDAVAFTDARLKPLLTTKGAEDRGGIFGGLVGAVSTNGKEAETVYRQDWRRLTDQADALRLEFAEGRADFMWSSLPASSAGRTLGEAMQVADKVMAIALASARLSPNDRRLELPDRISQAMADYNRFDAKLRGEHLEAASIMVDRLRNRLPEATGGAGEDSGKQLVPGLKVSPLTDDLRAKFAVPADARGLLVTSSDGEIPPGAVIVQINRQETLTLAAARSALQDGRNMFLVSHRDQMRYVAITVHSSTGGSEANEGKAVTYNAARGETLGQLAQEFGVTVEAIAQANKLEARADLQPRGLIRIPRREPAGSTSVQFVAPVVGPSARAELKLSILGAVNAPGTYTLAPGSDLARALAAAGGLSRVANARTVKITRGGPNGPLVFWVNTQSGEKGPVLEEGDIVFVPERLL